LNATEVLIEPGTCVLYFDVDWSLSNWPVSACGAESGHP